MQTSHTPRRRPRFDAKEALRLHINQLPAEMQVEFVCVALELLAEHNLLQASEHYAQEEDQDPIFAFLSSFVSRPM